MTSTTPVVRPAFQERSLPAHNAIIPAQPGWAVVLGPDLGDDIAVIGWHVSDEGTEAITVCGRHARAVLCHGSTVYHPNGRRESWEDYTRRVRAKPSAAKTTPAGRA